MAVAVRTLENFIGGEWVAATGESARDVVSPVTGETLAEAPDASPDDVRRAAADHPREVPRRDRRVDAVERAEVMRRIADLLDERYKAEALDDVAEMAESSSAEDAKRLETSVIVVKPSEWTPIAMADFMQVMADAGLPDGVVNVIYGAGEVGEALVTEPSVDCVAFVGSHTTAEKIVRAPGLKRTLIEASGNGPVVVCADADLELAAKGAVYGGFYCAGQVCAATERVLVDRRVHDDFLAAVVREAESWKVGDPFDDDTLVGPMNNEPTARKMDAHLEDAVAKGADVVLGGRREGGRPTRLYYQPTVVDNVGRDTLVNRDETFGPIVPLIAVDDDDDALAVANESHLGLQAAVYTRSLECAFRFSESLAVGSVIVNDSTMYWETLQPFGGAAGTRTGWGRVGGRHALEDMTDLRTVILDVGALRDPRDEPGHPPL